MVSINFRETLNKYAPTVNNNYINRIKVHTNEMIQYYYHIIRMLYIVTVIVILLL